MSKYSIVPKHLCKPHVFHKCNKESCCVCSDGLSWCTVCGGAEGSLLYSCPGYKINSETEDDIMNGKIIDFEYKSRYNIAKRKLNSKH